MNTYVLDYLYDFAVTLTYDVHDGNKINVEKYVIDYCDNQEIDLNLYKNTLKNYCDHYLQNGNCWFPDREEVEEWYSMYKKNKNIINV